MGDKWDCLVDTEVVEMFVTLMLAWAANQFPELAGILDIGDDTWAQVLPS